MKAFVLPFLLVLTLIGLGGCMMDEYKKEETQILEKAVSDYYLAISSFDCSKMDELTSKDFVIVEDYKLWNSDSVCTDLMQDKGATLKYVLKDFKVHIAENTAIVIYKLKETIEKEGVSKENVFLESAVLDRAPQSAIWNISFIHSTVVKK